MLDSSSASLGWFLFLVFEARNTWKLQLSKPWTSMAAAKIYGSMHSWAEISSPITFIIIVLHLFSIIGAKQPRISQLVHQEVRFQCLRFLQLLYGFNSALNVDHFDVWTMRFHPLCIKIFGFEVCVVKLFLSGSLYTLTYRQNHGHILDLRWETERTV
jgi:hypothetical protein